MSEYKRMARIEGIDLDTGTFSMTLATEGEASDGDILSIKGGQIPERMPMLNGHYNSATEQLGSITNPEKLLKDSPPRLKAVGHIEMAGEGASAEIRRDLAHMIDKGHVTGVSIRWDDVPGKSVRRVNLPSDHPYFVDAEAETDHRKRYGIYFEEWRAMEGSVVALGADPQALIGRADQTDGEVSSFWRAMAADAASGVESPSDPADVIEDEDVDPDARTAAALAALRTEAGFCHGIGASHADMINAVVDGSDTTFESVELDDGSLIFLPVPVADQLRAQLEAEVDEDLEDPTLGPASPPEVRADQPSPLTLDPEQIRAPIDVEALAALMSDSLDIYAERLERNVQAIFDLHVGKVK
jgi:hypothetical protein